MPLKRKYTKNDRCRKDKLNDAVRLTLETPNITNHEIAERLGVTEGAIRLWKKHPDWQIEEEKQKILMSDAVKELRNEKKLEFQKKLEDNLKKLETILDGLAFNALSSLKLSNTAYARLNKMSNPLEACRLGSRSGVHVHAENAMKASKAIVELNNQAYQINKIFTYFEMSDVNEDTDVNDDDIYDYTKEFEALEKLSRKYKLNNTGEEE